MAQASLSTVVGRSVSFVNGVLNGAWVTDMAFVTAVSRFLQLPKERLFSAELLEASSLRGKPRLAHLAQARRARVGRLGRQPAYWILRERRVRQAEISRLTGQSSGYVSLVFNGSMVRHAVLHRLRRWIPRARSGRAVHRGAARVDWAPDRRACRATS